ncbi:MAG: phosphoribosylformylglycinamidine synthase [Woeseiaceae bacterium]
MTDSTDRTPGPALTMIPGASALTEFRQRRLLRRIQKVHPEIASVAVTHLYLIYGSPLSKDDHRRLALLLNHGKTYPNSTHAARLFVAPRGGTISPWSSKATDIIHRCGLTQVDRIEWARCYEFPAGTDLDSDRLRGTLFDRMTEQCDASASGLSKLFERDLPRPVRQLSLGADAKVALSQANTTMGLALDAPEIDVLAEHFSEVGRGPTDAELMMFAQANSEHCRHKIFNASWVIDELDRDETLFGMIRNTTKQSPTDVVSAYSDNAAVLAGFSGQKISVRQDGQYAYETQDTDLLIKVETHNHPTAISPFPGAATGAGGEIRDEGATGLGSAPKAGLTGFTVSDLHIDDFQQPWERAIGKPDRIVSGLDIMLEGPLGGAAFNNEFGRPNLAGYFRTFQAPISADHDWGYHKPIMIAGGIGNVRREHALKKTLYPGGLVIVLGGPAMLIGLGGGAASSMASGASDAALDFASVQRGNPEMQRRAQEVINRCTAMGASNPIELIHDVGAGGLSNAVPEAVDHSSRGGQFELRNIPNDEPGMSPMEIWCNESQERYVLVVDPDNLATFEALCERERCPFAVLGRLRDDGQLTVTDEWSEEPPVSLPMDVLLGKTPRMQRTAKTESTDWSTFERDSITLDEAWRRVFALPAVADKSFLIHIADRTVGGLSSRDQLVGPWQVPVSDVAVTLTSHVSLTGEAMAMGERTPVACDDAVVAARLAVSESILNILAADIRQLSDIKLSANWMAAAGAPGQDAALFAAVKEVGLSLCPALGIAIPVGKDSLSMQTRWTDNEVERRVMSPVSLIVSAFAPVQDARRTLTPELVRDSGSRLLLVDLSDDPALLGRSALAQTFEQSGGRPADLSDADDLRRFAETLIKLRASDSVLAYHDRSDGGLLVTVAEMMFASRCGVRIELPEMGPDDLAWLFSEGPGVVLQVAADDLSSVLAAFESAGLNERVFDIGVVDPSHGRLLATRGSRVLLDETRQDMQLRWSETSFRMQALRDNPGTAAESYENIARVDDPGLNAVVTFDVNDDIAAPYIAKGAKPRVAVLREQGVNSQHEMAAAFMASGFEAIDVHMTDLQTGRVSLDDFQVLAACGGFSYGDVLGAGGGWAKSILMTPVLHDSFARFLSDRDTLALGICNGCQMLSQLSALVPGAEHWPRFVANRSAQFEARLSLVEVTGVHSPWLAAMQESRLPIVTSHGEGRAVFASQTDVQMVKDSGQIAMRFVDHFGQPTMHYPENPNGSEDGIAALTNRDGRVLISMPHPERVIRAVQHSWCPPTWQGDGGWLRLFRNARVELG